MLKEREQTKLKLSGSPPLPKLKATMKRSPVMWTNFVEKGCLLNFCERNPIWHGCYDRPVKCWRWWMNWQWHPTLERCQHGRTWQGQKMSGFLQPCQINYHRPLERSAHCPDHGLGLCCNAAHRELSSVCPVWAQPKQHCKQRHQCGSATPGLGDPRLMGRD